MARKASGGAWLWGVLAVVVFGVVTDLLKDETESILKQRSVAQVGC